MINLFLTLIIFLLIDAFWIIFVVSPEYSKTPFSDIMLDQPKLLPAVIFYVIFCFALWYLVIRVYGGDLKQALINAFLIGFTSYATYSFTNLAILQGWNWKVALMDTIWGGVISVIVSFIVIKLGF